jgi:hypothetical protein
MEIEKISVTLRPRSHWESLDLGVAMVQRWKWPVYRLWILITLPVLVALHLGLFSWQLPMQLPGLTLQFPLSLLVFWWLKPLFDRSLLMLAGGLLFDEPCSIWHVLRQWPRFLLRDGLGDLLLYRLNPARSFSLPVSQLENLSGYARVKRNRVLGYKTRTVAIWLTQIAVLFETVLVIMIWAGFFLLLPETYSVRFSDWLISHPQLSSLFLAISYYVAVSIIEPIYVCCGFSLYINRRTLLEAWDIQLAFVRMASRLARAGSHTMLSLAGGLLAVMLGVGAVMTLPSPVWANGTPPDQDTSSPLEISSDASGEVSAAERDAHWSCKSYLENRQTRADDLFWQLIDQQTAAHEQPCQKVKRWFRKEQNRDEHTAEPSWFERLWQKFSDYREAYGGLANVMAGILRLIIVLMVALFLFWLVHYAIRSVRHRARLETSEQNLPDDTRVFSSVFDQQIEPDRLQAEIRELLQAGMTRAAASLLYRAALTHLVMVHHLDIQPHATETESVRLLSPAIPEPVRGCFIEITHVWLQEAYQHQSVAHEKIQALCLRWTGEVGGGE